LCYRAGCRVFKGGMVHPQIADHFLHGMMA